MEADFMLLKLNDKGKKLIVNYPDDIEAVCFRE